MKGKLIENHNVYSTEDTKQDIVRTSINSTVSEDLFQPLEELKNDNLKAKLPAIVAACGTSDTIKFSERPKPIKKNKLETLPTQKKLNKLQSNVTNKINKINNDEKKLADVDVKIPEVKKKIHIDFG